MVCFLTRPPNAHRPHPPLFFGCQEEQSLLNALKGGPRVRKGTAPALPFVARATSPVRVTALLLLRCNADGEWQPLSSACTDQNLGRIYL
ncbi:hypothetical protein CDAR_478391 [Caerostris darwini]|uniref:Uncharacterized protein n=1 Tax=Caerostris darwini TaxID=1538125 RepID=A0AAV4VDB1_9ARAC|nr:hypothetical protein CDAR_478391 [Caerostris darwini]